MKKLGVIVNPFAGIGGTVGLKGSDGIAIQKKALALGAIPRASERAVQTLKKLLKMRDEIKVLTYSGQMGERAVLSAGLNPDVIGSPSDSHTTEYDTIDAAKKMASMNVDLILFAGGDGTARNLYTAIEQKVAVLGIPAGVKIHSGVYAINPAGAGLAAEQYLRSRMTHLKDAEVMDIDEDAYRLGLVSAKLYGYMKVPNNSGCIQGVKLRSKSEASTLNSIASEVMDIMKENVLYVIGPGSTTQKIMERLGINNTLIGIDVILNKKLVANDVSENGLWHLITANKKTKIILTCIGGQGHILGRGNQQISPRIIKRVGIKNFIIVATKEKLLSIKKDSLPIDTGDRSLDSELSGYARVITGYRDYVIRRIGSHIESVKITTNNI